MKETSEGMPFLIIMPVFNDWISLDPLLQQLDEELSRKDLEVEILLIDDGSTIKAPSLLCRMRGAIMPLGAMLIAGRSTGLMSRRYRRIFGGG